MRTGNWKSISGVSQSALVGALLAAAGMIATPQGALAQETPPESGKLDLGTLKVEDNGARNSTRRETGLPTMPGSLQDTPQAASVITSETMKEQGTASLEQALKNVPGITIAIGEGGTLAGDQFKIRGFDAKDDVYLDGLRDFGSYTRDSFNYEEVQVLKGPSGMMFGRGTTGGVVNTVSKTPYLDTSYSLEGLVGEGPYYRGLADVNYLLGDTSALRINVMATSAHAVDRDVVKSERWGVAPSIAWGIGTETTVTLSYLHQHDDRIPDYGIVIAQKPGELVAVPASENGVARSTFLGFNTDRDKTDTDIVTLRASHQATPWLVLTNDTRLAYYNRYFQYTSVDRCDNTSATNFCAATLFGPTPQNALAGIGGGGPYNMDAWGWQNIATARADNDFSNGTRNQLIAGFDYNEQTNDKAFYAYTLPSTLTYTYDLGTHTQSRSNIGRPLFGPDHNPPPDYTVFRPTLATIAGSSATATTTTDSHGHSTDFAFFATDRFWFDDQWSVIAGVRWDSYDASYQTINVSGTIATLKVKSEFFSPRAALVFEPDENQTFYLSYSKSSTPQATSVVGAATPVTTANTGLEPEKNETFEAGAKINLLDGALGLTASLFQVTKGNAVQVDPTSGIIETQSGEKQRVRGLELSATGQIAEGLSLQAAYTYLDSETLQSFSCGGGVCNPNPYIIGMPVIFVPKNSASLWTTYELGDLAPGFTVAGGVTYQDEYNTRYLTSGTAPNPMGLSQIARIPETFSLDGLIAYEAGQWRFALNGYNLTDQLNYSQAFGNRGTPAPGRYFVFSVGMKT
ncbi:MAG: TonB-dependent receptor [Alphaproteobacteria bacterium]|nr:TonB-dependent receptor [Alphaproteobacteria bacterium]